MTNSNKPPKRFSGKVFLVLILPLLVWLTVGFGSCSAVGKPPVPSPAKTHLLLIYCDVTTSVDEKSIDKVIEKARTLVASLQPNSRIVAFPIDDNDYPEPLFNEELPACENNNLTPELAEISRKECLKTTNQKLPPLKEKISQAIKSRYDEVLNDKSIPKRSCIIDTLRKIHEFFKKEDPAKADLEVVYLSDMIEQCKSRVGSIYLCSSGQKPNKETILKQIEDQYKPDFNLKEILGNNISFVITTKMMGGKNAHCLFPEDQRDIWEKVFNKVGYSKQDFDSFPFGSELPGKFKVAAPPK